MGNRLGKTIRILRQARSMKMTDVAKSSCVSVPYLSLVENGSRQPSLDVLRRLAGTLGVPSEALVVMGMAGASLTPTDERTAGLTNTLGRLIEMESALATLLGKESRSGTKGDSAGTSR